MPNRVSGRWRRWPEEILSKVQDFSDERHSYEYIRPYQTRQEMQKREAR